jgi:hypothetical protein
LNGFLFLCFTASPSQHRFIVAQAEHASKLQQNLPSMGLSHQA